MSRIDEEVKRALEIAGWDITEWSETYGGMGFVADDDGDLRLRGPRRLVELSIKQVGKPPMQRDEALETLLESLSATALQRDDAWSESRMLRAEITQLRADLAKMTRTVFDDGVYVPTRAQCEAVIESSNEFLAASGGPSAGLPDAVAHEVALATSALRAALDARVRLDVERTSGHHACIAALFWRAGALRLQHDVDKARDRRDPTTFGSTVVTASYLRGLRRQADEAEILARSLWGKSIDTPADDYACMDCGLSGVRLWRPSNTFLEHVVLRCRGCAEINQPGKSRPHTDQIGWLIPAVPTDDGTFWGYTSVPEDRVAWWKALPEVPRG